MASAPRCFRRALELKPDDAMVWRNLGVRWGGGGRAAAPRSRALHVHARGTARPWGVDAHGEPRGAKILVFFNAFSGPLGPKFKETGPGAGMAGFLTFFCAQGLAESTGVARFGGFPASSGPESAFRLFCAARPGLPLFYASCSARRVKQRCNMDEPRKIDDNSSTRVECLGLHLAKLYSAPYHARSSKKRGREHKLHT